MRTSLTTLTTVLGLLVVLIGAACSPSTSGPASQSSAKPTESDAKPAAAKPAAPAQPAAASADAAQQTLPELDRMIVRTVTMTISVVDVQEAYRQVERIAIEQRGLIAGSQIRQDGDRTTGTITVRVPADPTTYQATLERLRGIADRVLEEQSQAQDITEEFVDLESRLRNLQATEDTLRALLARAQRIEDILPIQRELTTVRGQIEQIQGRKQALERRADLATITLQLRERGALGRNGWDPGATLVQALAALAVGVRILATVAIWLVVWSPIWGGVILLIWLLRRFARPRWRPRPTG